MCKRTLGIFVDSTRSAWRRVSAFAGGRRYNDRLHAHAHGDGRIGLTDNYTQVPACLSDSPDGRPVTSERESERVIERGANRVCVCAYPVASRRHPSLYILLVRFSARTRVANRTKIQRNRESKCEIKISLKSVMKPHIHIYAE